MELFDLFSRPCLVGKGLVVAMLRVRWNIWNQDQYFGGKNWRSYHKKLPSLSILGPLYKVMGR